MFPNIWPAEELVDRDFSLLDLQFGRTVAYFLPCDSVGFIPVSPPGSCEDDGNAPECNPAPEEWRAGVDLVKKERQPVVSSNGDLLFLPIWRSEELAAVAVLSSVGSLKYGDYPADWLHERSRLISRELAMLKQLSFDTQSGLLNGALLREEMVSLLSMMSKELDNKAVASDNFWSVFLVEIYHGARNSAQSTADIARAAACLNSFIGELVPLHHFGSGLFGMLWNSEHEGDFRKLGYALLRKLKRQSFGKVHIGIVPLSVTSGKVGSGECSKAADKLLSQAWEFLLKAKRRGPFAVCSAVGEQAAFTFRPPSEQVLAELKKLMRRFAKFSVALLQADEIGQGNEPFPKRIFSLVGSDTVLLPESGCEAYLFLPDVSGSEALARLHDLKEKINRLDGPVFSLGVADFPCASFTKRDTAINARKAMSHTAFFGPGSVTAFDGVSLNISGDVYYNEGDLNGAIREYKLGLKLDSHNINLLNSLAVIYAQIDRYHQAIPLFEKVLELDERDFMALFNLGFAHMRTSDLARSVQYFERALAVDGDYFDLCLQLGKSYCKLARYQDAVQVLERAESAIPEKSANLDSKPWRSNELNGGAGADMGADLLFRYLGKAYHGIGNNKKAMTYLQKAIAYNPRDAKSLSRLGELYFAEKQGEEIAISFCRQAINIDGAGGIHWYRLAAIQFALNSTAESLDSLQKCLRVDRKNINALLLMAKVYKCQGKSKKIKATYERVLRLDGTNTQAKQGLKKI